MVSSQQYTISEFATVTEATEILEWYCYCFIAILLSAWDELSILHIPHKNTFS